MEEIVDDYVKWSYRENLRKHDETAFDTYHKLIDSIKFGAFWRYFFFLTSPHHTCSHSILTLPMNTFPPLSFLSCGCAHLADKPWAWAMFPSFLNNQNYFLFIFIIYSSFPPNPLHRISDQQTNYMLCPLNLTNHQEWFYSFFLGNQPIRENHFHHHLVVSCYWKI